MSKEQLFDFLSEAFAKEYPDIEFCLYQHLYGYLMYNSIKSFYQYLRTLHNVWSIEFEKSKTVSLKFITCYYMQALLRLMSHINRYSEKEIFKW